MLSKLSFEKLSFEMIAEEQRVCKKHRQEYISRMFLRNDGSKQWSTCPTCREETDIEKLRQEHIQVQIAYKQRLINKLFEQAAIPPRFSENTFDNYIADTEEKIIAKNGMLRFANEIDTNLKLGRNIILSGNPGNGKTHLSVAMLKAAIDKNYTALLITAGEMVDKIYAAGWNKTTIINNYGIPDLLVLDEVTLGLNNEEQKNLIKVLNKRYELRRSTLVLTNLAINTPDGNDLKSVLGEGIIDRFRQDGGFVLYFSWESFRK